MASAGDSMPQGIILHREDDEGTRTANQEARLQLEGSRPQQSLEHSAEDIRVKRGVGKVLEGADGSQPESDALVQAAKASMPLTFGTNPIPNFATLPKYEANSREKPYQLQIYMILWVISIHQLPKLITVQIL